MTCCVAIKAKEGDCWIKLDNCKVVFDVTQISYQSSDRVYQASRALQRKFSLYRAQKVNIAVFSLYRVGKVNEGKISVHRARKVNEGNFSVYRVEKVSEQKLVFTEFTRYPKAFA